jgi:hypothetical protein
MFHGFASIYYITEQMSVCQVFWRGNSDFAAKLFESFETFPELAHFPFSIWPHPTSGRGMCAWAAGAANLVEKARNEQALAQIYFC